jgi:subtilisin family serine protease
MALPVHQPMGAAHGGQPPGGIVPNEIILTFLDRIPNDIYYWAEEMGGTVLIVEDSLAWVSMRFSSRQEAEAAMKAASLRRDVKTVEHDTVGTIFGSSGFLPNDPGYGHQWGFSAIHAPGAWAMTLGTHQIRIAILDTGIDGHPDLEPNVCGPHETFVPFGDPRVDANGHGTHVAGTAAAVIDNGVGVAGMSQSCLMSVQVADSGGAWQSSWLAAGITWAAANGADIISMSLGSYFEPPEIVARAVRSAYLQGTLLVAVVGPLICSDDNQYSIAWPARYPQVIAVASVDAPDGSSPSIGSSCGPEVELAAPGSLILSTLPLGQYGNMTGTSMATPHVSGLAALVLSVAARQPAEVRSMLNATADDIWLQGWDTRTGWGRINATAAIEYALDFR